jgi:hypothetical protein
MCVRTLALYLIGNRQAILDLAADRRCLWVGLLFVLSAGFAREYDGEDLLREPWHLFVPVGASLLASFLLFLIACGPVFLQREGRPPFLSAYRAFLTLFWMTAPLAWLYAVPYERFLSPGMATSVNLWTLALVAIWRVALMISVVSVITGRDILSSLLLVMVFADAVALTVMYLMPKPVVSIMGGIRLSESEAAVLNATFLASCLGILSAPLWAIGGVMVFFSGRPVWQVPARPTEPALTNHGMWVLAGLSLAIWLPILPWTQAEQRLRSQVEEDMKTGRIADALEVMSAHAPSDFPPYWDPPPREGYGEKSPHLFVVMDEILTRGAAPWVRGAYVDKLRRHMGREYWYFDYENDDLARLVRILKQLPEGPDIVTEHREDVERLLSRDGLAAEQRENLNELLKRAGTNVQPNP